MGFLLYGSCENICHKWFFSFRTPKNRHFFAEEYFEGVCFAQMSVRGTTVNCRIERCRINIWHFEFRVFSLLHFFTSFNFPLMLVCFQAKVHSCRFEILHRFCHSVWVYCKMSHLIYALMQISSPGYYLTWIFPSGKNCHAVVIPGFKCDSII